MFCLWLLQSWVPHHANLIVLFLHSYFLPGIRKIYTLCIRNVTTGYVVIQSLQFLNFSIKVKHFKKCIVFKWDKGCWGCYYIYTVVWLNIDDLRRSFVYWIKKKCLALTSNQKALGMCIQKFSLQYGILLLWQSFHLYMLAGSPLII